MNLELFNLELSTSNFLVENIFGSPFHYDTSGQAARNKLEAAIARIVRRERFTEIQARNAADETIYAARHDATNCIQPRKLAAALERIERRHRIRRDTLLARQVRGGFIPSYMQAWRHIGAE